jgi:hypothetical protein
MTDKELDNILKTIKIIPDGNDEFARTVLKLATDSITLSKLQDMLPSTQQTTPDTINVAYAITIVTVTARLCV